MLDKLENFVKKYGLDFDEILEILDNTSDTNMLQNITNELEKCLT